LSDYEDFTAAFAGVGKAQAVELWNGESRVVHLTVGTARGLPLYPGSLLYDNLLAAIKASRSTEEPLVLQGFKRIYFYLEAKVLVDSTYDRSVVLAAVQKAVQDAYTFNVRKFGQAVTSAEVISLIQSIPGIIASDLDKLYREDMTPGLNSILEARPAKLLDSGTGLPPVYLPGELLLLHPIWTEPGEMKP